MKVYLLLAILSFLMGITALALSTNSEPVQQIANEPTIQLTDTR